MVLFLLSGAANAEEKVVYTFTGGYDGGAPLGDLVQDAQGNYYGTTLFGGGYGGTVFELSPNSNGAYTETVIHAFMPSPDGNAPLAGVIFDSQGKNLYGTTSGGGAFDGGTVFELSPNGDGSWTEQTLYSFCAMTGCTDGYIPESKLIFDQQGNLYGTTGGGGSGGGGTVFQLSPNGLGGYSETVIYNFINGGSTGYGPTSGVAIDSAGNLYGTTPYGGAQTCTQPGENGGIGCGLVYKLSQSQGSWSYTVLQNFTGFDGIQPLDEVILDSSGNLYGTTLFGGLLGPCAVDLVFPLVYSSGFTGIGCGTVFELSPDGNGIYSESILYRFVGGNDGAHPYAHLTLDASGNLYGTTLSGGGVGCPPQGCGTAFELTPATGGGWQEIILNSFTGLNGAAPTSALIQGGSGQSAHPLAKHGCIAHCAGSCSGGGAAEEGIVYVLSAQ